MRLIVPIFVFNCICMVVCGQKLTIDSNYLVSNALYTISPPNNHYSNTFLGNRPFWPYLVRKVNIGHPEGAIGFGLTQQYKLHPHPYGWQNEYWNQPLTGLPQYPNFVLQEVSPTLSRFKNPVSMQSFSSGLLNAKGINMQFKEAKWVQGLPFKK